MMATRNCARLKLHEVLAAFTQVYESAVPESEFSKYAWSLLINFCSY